eukprot:Clim_evm4s247 gene=Clim_evmTU4s247
MTEEENSSISDRILGVIGLPGEAMLPIMVVLLIVLPVGYLMDYPMFDAIILSLLGISVLYFLNKKEDRQDSVESSTAMIRFLASQYDTNMGCQAKDPYANAFVKWQYRMFLSIRPVRQQLLRGLANQMEGAYVVMNTRCAMFAQLVDEELSGKVPYEQVISVPVQYSTIVTRLVEPTKTRSEPKYTLRNTKIFQLDKPAVLEHRANCLAYHGFIVKDPSQRKIIDIPCKDAQLQRTPYAEPVLGAIRACNEFEERRKTLVILESTCGSTQKDDWLQLIRGLTKAIGPGSKIIMDFATKGREFGDRSAAASTENTAPTWQLDSLRDVDKFFKSIGLEQSSIVMIKDAAEEFFEDPTGAKVFEDDESEDVRALVESMKRAWREKVVPYYIAVYTKK